VRPYKKTTMRHLIIALLLCFAQSAFALPPIHVMERIKAMYPNSGRIVQADLNNDGLDDIVLLDTKKDKDRLRDVVVVLKGLSEDFYALFATSSDIEYGTADIEIKRQSIFIRVFHNSLTLTFNEVYQFKYDNQSAGFFLIGQEENSYASEDEIKRTISTNYLTGMVIERELSNGKTREIKHKIPANERHLLKLEAFSR
jgi:hypothetical protein